MRTSYSKKMLHGIDPKEIMPLPLSEELELGRRISQGDNEARRKLVLANLKLVEFYVWTRNLRSEMAEDLFQEAILALWRAAGKYDWQRGYAFGTFAQCTVRKTVHHNSWETHGVHLPKRALDAYYRLRKTLQLAEKELTLDEIAEKTGDDIGMVRHLMFYHNFVIPVELDALVMPDGSPWAELEDVGPRPGRKLTTSDTRRRLLEMVDSLPVRLSTILQMSFGLWDDAPSSHREIAAKLSIAQSAVSRWEREALLLLRERYADELADLLHEG